MAIPSYYQDTRIEPLADGLIDLLKKNLVAHTKLLSDANAGDTKLHVGNTLRFEKGEQILIRDNNSVWNDETNTRTGLEFHTIGQSIYESEYLFLKEPLQQRFLVGDNARLQKTIYNIPLYPEDIYYGDRQVITWDYVAIAIEPESMSPEWIALPGILSTEYKMAIMVYVRMGSTNDTKNFATRVCHSYADAIHRLLIGNIHVDLGVDDTPLLADVNPGQNFVYVSTDVAGAWPPDHEIVYDVQDNFHHESYLAIVPDPATYTSGTSSSSASSSISAEWSSATSSQTSLSSPSSGVYSSESSVSSEVSTSSSSESSNTSSSSSLSLSSAQTPPGVKIWLSRPLQSHYRVSDKAVLRRRMRYMYDSRVTNIVYGEMQKGEIVKAAHLSWFGKETQHIQLTQIGKGGNSY